MSLTAVAIVVGGVCGVAGAVISLTHYLNRRAYAGDMYIHSCVESELAGKITRMVIVGSYWCTPKFTLKVWYSRADSNYSHTNSYYDASTGQELKLRDALSNAQGRIEQHERTKILELAETTTLMEGVGAQLPKQ